MNTTMDLIQQKLRDLTNRLDLLYRRSVGDGPSADSSTITNLKNEINLIKQQTTSLQTSINEIENQYSLIIENINTFSLQIENLSAATSSDITTLQSNINSQDIKINQLQQTTQNSITDLNARLVELSNSIDNLTHYVNGLILTGSAADNELCFIVNGTYVPESDIDKIANGTYTL